MLNRTHPPVPDFRALFAGNVSLFALRMDAPTSVAIEAEIKALNEELDDLVALGDDELDDTDVARMEEIENLLKRKNTIFNARKAAEERAAKPRGRRTTPEATRTPTTPAPGPRRRADPVPAQPKNQDDEARHGFKFFGEFAHTVLQAYKNGGPALERMENAATTYGSESVGADGGYLVPPEFRQEIWQKVNGEDSLLSRTAPFTTGRNSLTFPKDETTPWDNSAGIRVFWEGEGDVGTESKPKFETSTARLNKLMALIKVTEELYEDAPGLDSYLRFWTPVKMVARCNTAIVRGTGVGQPLGILNSPSLITISKENSQNAASIIMPNINKMWNRLYAPLRQNAVWLINQEIEPMLEGMAFIAADNGPGGSNSNQTLHVPVYMPSGGLADAPFARLKGRPVIPMQPCSQLGTIGDIILTDLNQYMSLTKGTGIQEDVSIHLHFDQAIDTFRFIFRVTGQPLWNAVITPENGTNTYGWAVVMETRS